MPRMAKRAPDIVEGITHRAESNPDIVILWLYGSRARGDYSQASDYDFAVAFQSFPDDPLERQVRPEQLAMTWTAELDIPDDKIGVVDINLAPIPLAGEILAEGKVLICKNDMRLYREESRISSMIELDWNHHRSHYG